MQKMRFLAIFLSLVCWIDLILYIVIVLNVYQLSAMLPGQAGSFKSQKNAFLNDPKCQEWGFWPFSQVTNYLLVIESFSLYVYCSVLVVVWEADRVKSNPKTPNLGPIFFERYDHKGWLKVGPQKKFYGRPVVLDLSSIWPKIAFLVLFG